MYFRYFSNSFEKTTNRFDHKTTNNSRTYKGTKLVLRIMIRAYLCTYVYGLKFVNRMSCNKSYGYYSDEMFNVDFFITIVR